MNASLRTLERFRLGLLWRSRCSRALTVVALSIGSVAAAHALLTVVRIAGWIAYSRWSTGTTAGAALLVVLVGTVALALPLREARVLRTADRRLHLQGALVTAMEVRDSTEPIHRLLVRGTARAVETTTPGSALPFRPHGIALIVPALIVLAFGLDVVAIPRSRDRERTSPPRTEVEFSRDLQAVVAGLYLEDTGSGEAGSQEDVRTLLRIDGELLRGEITPDQARAQLARWLDSRASEGAAPNTPRRTDARTSSDPGTDGRSTVPSASLVAAVRALMSPSSGDRSSPRAGQEPGGARSDNVGVNGFLIGGRGEGAGRGVAAGGPHGERDRGPGTGSRGESTWVLPASSRFPDVASVGSPLRSEADTLHPGSSEQSGSRLGVETKRLTAREHEVVAAYFRALDRRYGERERQTQAVRSTIRKTDEEESPR